ncbi:hypothetical protein Ct9H90mP29_13960 [bacterium]|nr:MAG: hypothetical protein Ct9H90mP29_13960 [bacterium]
MNFPGMGRRSLSSTLKIILFGAGNPFDHFSLDDHDRHGHTWEKGLHPNEVWVWAHFK